MGHIRRVSPQSKNDNAAFLSLSLFSLPYFHAKSGERRKKEEKRMKGSQKGLGVGGAKTQPPAKICR